MKRFLILLVITLSSSTAIPAESLYYEVKKNDTLWSISRAFDVDIDALRRINQIGDERSLSVGMRLLIPSVYEIEKGDTLWGIAQKHQTSVHILRELNDLSSDEIKVGEFLFIPSSADDDAESSDAVEESTGNVSGLGEGLDAPFWPHSGARTARTGKLSGTEFVGNEGDEIISISAGEVVWSAPNRGYGNVVIIKSEDDYLYLYTGLATVFVERWQRIGAGTKIAELGKDPHTGESKLLFSVYRNGKLIDPLKAPRG